MQFNVVIIREAPFHVNPLTQFWQILEAPRILWHFSPIFFKLEKIIIVQLLGLVECE
jgi:hypothetical protein